MSPAPPGYDPARCVLCGATTTALVMAHPSSMSSDSRVASAPLHKVRCTACGLVRNGDPLDEAFLDHHYREAYTLAPASARAEPRMAIHGRDLPRSAFFHEWIGSSLVAAGAPPPRRIAEIGCGDGLLLQRFAAQYPDAQLLGIDPQPGPGTDRLRLEPGDYTRLTGEWDLIYAVAVLEHIPRPDHFLAHLRGCLAPGGVLVLTQPSQDNGCNDIFYFDHLHHFFADHVAALAAHAGLRELLRVPRHRIVPEFSLQVFEAAPGVLVPDLDAARYDVSPTIDTWTGVFRRTDAWLDRHPGPVAVWGLGMTFTLLQAFSRLGQAAITAGIDDNPARFEGAGLPFPVIPSRAAADGPVFDSPVLFTFRPGPALRSLPRAGYLVPLEAE